MQNPQIHVKNFILKLQNASTVRPILTNPYWEVQKQ